MVTKEIKDYVITPQTIVVSWKEGEQPSVVPSSNKSFGRVVAKLTVGDWPAAALEIDRALKISTASKGKFNVINGNIVIDGEELPEALSEKLISMVDAGEDTGPFERFWDNLAENPSKDSRDDLYSFVERNGLLITLDGCFVAYKKVRSNYWDCYTSNTFHCIPGAILEMERSVVDPDRHQVCSAGIHVAAWPYLGDFGGKRNMACKVNPADVVTVPTDYDRQKIRVCRAQIMGEVDEPLDGEIFDDENANSLDTTEKVVEEFLAPDRKGRIRVPGRWIRKLDVGVGGQVEVIYQDPFESHLKIRQVDEDDDNCVDWRVYTVDADNAIRVSKEVLDWALLDDVVIVEFYEHEGCLILSSGA